MHTLQGNEFVLFYLRLHPNDPCHSLFDQFWQQHMLCIHLSVSGMRNFKWQFSSVKNVKLRLKEPLVKLFANKSLEFVLNGCFRKIFRTTSAEVVQNCMLVFNCLSIYRSVLQNANVIFLQIMLNLITYYVMSVKTLLHMNWIC